MFTNGKIRYRWDHFKRKKEVKLLRSCQLFATNGGTCLKTQEFHKVTVMWASQCGVLVEIFTAVMGEYGILFSFSLKPQISRETSFCGGLVIVLSSAAELLLVRERKCALVWRRCTWPGAAWTCVRRAALCVDWLPSNRFVRPNSRQASLIFVDVFIWCHRLLLLSD